MFTVISRHEYQKELHNKVFKYCQSKQENNMACTKLVDRVPGYMHAIGQIWNIVVNIMAAIWNSLIKVSMLDLQSKLGEITGAGSGKCQNGRKRICGSIM